MAQISDVIHASAVFDAARQELAWAYSGDFTDVPEPMKGAVHFISEVLNEAEMRWVTSTREEQQEPMVVVATGGGEKKKKREDAGVVTKEADTKNNPMATGDGEEKKREGEAESKVKDWLLRLEEVACDMRAVARKELIGDYSKTDDRVVVATGGGEKKKKREDAGVVTKEADTPSIEQAERGIKGWLERLQKKLLGGYSRIDDKLSARWLPCLPRGTSRADRIAPTIDTVALKLEELKKQYDFGYSTGLPLAATCMEQPACSSGAGGQEGRETSFTGDVLVEWGDDAKQRIMDSIIDGISWRCQHHRPTILPIVGPPCVGKTTLLKSIFTSEAIEEGYKVWVDMRKGWDIKQIQESIIELLGRDGINEDGEENHIGKLVSEADYGDYITRMLVFKKTVVFLVLDNLVEEQDSSMLEKLLTFLHEIGELMVALVTTRSEALANYITRFKLDKYQPTVKPYRLHPSSDDMCLEILKRTSGLNLEAIAAGNSETAAVAGQIASKCSGIPLAAKALGRFLQSVNPQELPGQIRDIWNIGGGFSCDSQQLRRLPIHSATAFTHLKHSSGGVLEVGAESWLSLAYCAFFVFPKGKGHGVVTRDLLNQWCSLGITTRERGASCISELLGRSLLLGEKPASPDDEDEILAATLLRMEDLMHDFARYHLGDRLIIVDGTNGAAPPTSSSRVNSNKSSGARLALVSNFNVKQQLDIASILPAAGILALRFEGCGEMELSEAEFASAKYACLRLLDLSGCSLKKLPHSIHHLKQLRYLRAPGITDQVFPIKSITSLHELRYLILRMSCQLKNLTEEFQRLSNLLYLDLSGCSGLETLPDKFGRLWRLEHLDMSACSGIEALPESFGWLPSLSHLDLSGCSRLEALPESFGGLHRLWHLDMSCCSGLRALPESFGGLHRLWHLDMSGCSGLGALPTSFEHLTELRHLDLSACSGFEALPESLGWLRSLRHLNLSGCSGLQDLPTSFQRLTELRHLDLSGLSRLQALRMVELPTELRHLNLSGCSGLRQKQLPDAREPFKLRHLDLSRCSSVSCLPDSYARLENLVHLNLSGCSSLENLIPFPNRLLAKGLKHLDLSHCSKLRDLPDPSWLARELKELRYLDLSGCSSLWLYSELVQKVRSRGGRASEPEDASLSEQGASGTTN